MNRGTQAIKRQLRFSFALQNQMKFNFDSGAEFEKNYHGLDCKKNGIKNKLIVYLMHLVSLRRFHYSVNKS